MRHSLSPRLARGSFPIALLAAAVTDAAGAQAPATPAATPAGRPAATFAVPLLWRGAVRGDVVVQVSADGSAAVDARSLAQELRPLLNDAGNKALDDVTASAPFVTTAELDQAGFRLEFDMARLELVLVSIAAELRPVESLDGASRRQEDSLPVTHEPARVSAYLNTNVGLIYRDGEGLVSPDLFWVGAARVGKLVVEAEAGVTDTFGGYGFYRQGVRAIYDQPERYRRFIAGDLRLNSTGALSTIPTLGGFAIQRSRRAFDPSFSFRALGGRRIQIDTPSTVQVLVNGAPFRTLDLDPGTYDLSNLPIEAGANDIQLVIKDAAGRETVTRLDMFFDPPDLETGDHEYTAAIGVVSEGFGLSPRYSNTIAAVLNYRRAFSGNLLLGGGLQISQHAQLFSGEARFVPQFLPGTIDLEVAASTGRSTGFAARAGYRWFSASNVRERQSLSLTLDYQSKGFGNLSALNAFRLERLSGTATYSRALSDRTYANIGASAVRVPGLGTQSTIFGDINRQLSPRLVGTIGAEYGGGDVLGRNIGVRVGLSMLLGGRRRLDAIYQSRRDFARVAVSRSVENFVGSHGYSLGLVRSLGSTGLEGTAEYVANRFDARLAVSTQGSGLGNIVDRRTARLQIGTSLAYADGAFGVGRPINDAFMLARPTSALRDVDAVLGRSLSPSRYEARSGSFGAAVIGQLQSYDTQEVQYDLKGKEQVYDIGEGLARIRPPLHAGYRLTVGNDRYVSIVGSLVADGAPVELAGGTVAAIDDRGFQEQPFFTNSAGRFGIMGLAPGRRYTVRLTDGRSFEIAVPNDSGTLVRMNGVTLSSGDK